MKLEEGEKYYYDADAASARYGLSNRYCFTPSGSLPASRSNFSTGRKTALSVHYSDGSGKITGAAASRNCF